ncbi:MAG: glycosyl transferase family 4, partial [Gemmatimonadota bacterium]|nr:glycosyl transferase family 4 [Gemmatimonadota bacterium]
MAIACALALLVSIISYLLTALVRKYALRNDVLDHPNERSSHSAPTPRGGGVAALAALGIALIVGTAIGAIAERDALTLGLGTLVLGVVGGLDDRGGLRPRTRLAAHLAVAVWTLSMFGGLPSLAIGTGSIHLGAAGFVLGVLGIIWSINLFNFMDGIDGLAGSQALLIFGAGATLLFASGDGSL